MTRKQWIAKFARGHRWTFVLGLIVITLMTLVNLIFPFLNGEIINIALYEKDMIAFRNLCFFYTGVLIFNQFIIASMNNLILSQLRTSFVFDIQRELFKKILHNKGRDLSNMYSGDMISRMNEDTVDFVNLIFRSIFWGYSNVLHIIFSIGFMFYFNRILGVLTIILVPIVFYSSKYFKNKSQKIFKQISKNQGRLSSYLFEIIKNMQEIKILNAGKNVIRLYSKNTTIINRLKIENGKIEVTSERVNAFISLIAQMMIFITCAYYIVNNQMKLGVFVAAVSYFNMAVTYFSNLNRKIIEAGKYNVSIQRVIDILNEEGEDYKEGSVHKEIKNGNVIFKDVTFGFSKDKVILDDINFHVESGKMIGIVGGSGSGKTTISNLLCNLYSDYNGEILMDGVCIKEYDLHCLRSQIGIVHQEAILYENTLRYNLSFSNDECNDDELIGALQKATLYGYYLSLPDGLNTKLGTDGQELSGGQKQRLAIARILIKNPQILIFDESTSSLDSQNEGTIRELMQELSRDRTVFIISHRLSTIKYCDKILVLEDGIIKGFDSHNNLILSNKSYINLFSKQSLIGGEAI